jgi:hypothetical protein
MAKRRGAVKKPRKRQTTRKRPEVSRYEYARLCLQVGAIESQAKRNRIDLDIQLRRIAQLQDELDSLKKRETTRPIPPDSLLIPLPKPSVES